MGNGALQNEPHNKKIMHNYLRKLFSTTFSKYSKVNPRVKCETLLHYNYN